jgi:hypothetical protein
VKDDGIKRLQKKLSGIGTRRRTASAMPQVFEKRCKARFEAAHLQGSGRRLRSFFHTRGKPNRFKLHLKIWLKEKSPPDF